MKDSNVYPNSSLKGYRGSVWRVLEEAFLNLMMILELHIKEEQMLIPRFQTERKSEAGQVRIVFGMNLHVSGT